LKSKLKVLLRVGIFGVILALMIAFMSSVFQPVWLNWNNFYTIYGFYEEPEDTNEVVFLGASTFTNGVIPTELYEKYGICAYNMATENQPMLTSYYWLKETYNRHNETLKTVVVEVASLRAVNKKEFYHKALDGMKLSLNKLEAVRAHVGNDIGAILGYLIPLNSYHTRWDSLEANDIEKYSYDPVNGSRGYNFDHKTFIRTRAYKDIPIKATVPDKDAEPSVLQEEPLKYFEKIVEFCNEKKLNLVMVKTPTNNWDSSGHYAVKALSEKHSLDFYDFNYGDLYYEMGFSRPLDTIDGNHMNYYGATKFTSVLGKILSENYKTTDVRGNEKYAFLEQHLEKYKQTIMKRAEILEAPDITRCLEVTKNGDYTVFIMAKEDATKALTDEQRSYFDAFGLKKLYALSYRDSYIAVIDNGKVIFESSKPSSDSGEAISMKGKLPDGKDYSVKSGGFNHSNTAVCNIGSKQYADNKRGLNVVIYSNKYSEVISSVYYDTYSSSGNERYTLDIALSLVDEERAQKYKDNEFYKMMLDYKERTMRRTAEANK